MTGAMRPKTIERIRPWVALLRRYHRHEVYGLEAFPRSGPVLLALNHSFASYDGVLLAAAIADATGRIPRALGDRLIFKLPGLRDVAASLGVVEGSPETAAQLLGAGEVVIVAPGGMAEALRPRGQRYEIMWEGRRGFVREAARAGAPIVLAACPRADDIFTLYDNPLTRHAYRRWRLPVPVLRGAGPSLLPRPVRLIHAVTGPIAPPPTSNVVALHGQLLRRMGDLMVEAFVYERHPPAPIPKTR